MIENETRLDSWKEIADHLGRDVRTVIRWEKERSLPVHRIPGQKRSGVYAWPSELDSWLQGSEIPGTPPNGAGPNLHNGAAPALPTPSPDPLPLPQRGRPRKSWLIVLAGAASLVVALGVLGYWLRPEAPRIAHPVRITSDGQHKGRTAISAKFLFITSISDGRTTITRTNLDGDEQSVISLPFKNADLFDASLDGSELLVSEGGSDECNGPLWVISTNGVPARRLANLCAGTAAWSPEGRKLAYALGSELYVANFDGRESRRLITLPLLPSDLRWSPDARFLRACLHERGTLDQLWDIPLDGSVARMVLPGWHDGANDSERAGRWTPDARFFIFGAVHNGIMGLWVLRSSRRFPAWSGQPPSELAQGLRDVFDPVPSKDGKKLFATLDSPDRADLLRYEPKARGFVPFTDTGLSGGHAVFSPDGNKVAYISFPKMALWKMNADGTDRQLLAPRAALPEWSPDGRRIAFMSVNEGSDASIPSRIRVISSDGGTPDQPVHSPEWQGKPTWTADGGGLIFGDNGRTFPISASCSLHRFDFKSGKTFDLPNSNGLWTARASPAGRYIAAVTRDNRKLVLYDMQASVWTQLASFRDSVVGDNPIWSKDGTYIYFDAPDSPDPAIYRIRVPGTQLERVASLKGIDRVHAGMGQWIGLTPNNQPMVIRDLHSQEIVAWDLVAP